MTLHPDPDEVALGVFVRLIPGWKLVVTVAVPLLGPWDGSPL